MDQKTHLRKGFLSTIARGIAGVLIATSGYAQDLTMKIADVDAYAQKYGKKVEISINGRSSDGHMIDAGDVQYTTIPGYSWITMDGSTSYALFDQGKDGTLDRLVQVPGRLDKRDGPVWGDFFVDENALSGEITLSDLIREAKEKFRGSPVPHAQRKVLVLQDGKVRVYDMGKQTTEEYSGGTSFQRIYEGVIIEMSDILSGRSKNPLNKKK